MGHAIQLHCQQLELASQVHKNYACSVTWNQFTHESEEVAASSNDIHL